MSKYKFYSWCALLIASLNLIALPTLKAEESSSPKTKDSSKTVLELSANGYVTSMPDELKAEMTAEVWAQDASAAQEKLNKLVQSLLIQAKQLPDLKVSLTNYWVGATDKSSEEPGKWKAQQVLQLSSKQDKTLLNFVGKAQASGVRLSQLKWNFSILKKTDLTTKAEITAVKELQKRAASLAESMGLKVGEITKISLENNDMPLPPVYNLAGMRSRTATDYTLPQTTQEEQTIVAHVSATIILHH